MSHTRARIRDIVPVRGGGMNVEGENSPSSPFRAVLELL
jgi:hypothetical protein